MNAAPLHAWVVILMLFSGCQRRVDARDIVDKIPRNESVWYVHVDSDEAAFVSTWVDGHYTIRGFSQDVEWSRWHERASRTVKLKYQSNFVIGHAAWEMHPQPYLVVYEQGGESEMNIAVFAGPELAEVGHWTLSPNSRVSVVRDELWLHDESRQPSSEAFRFLWKPGLEKLTAAPVPQKRPDGNSQDGR